MITDLIIFLLFLIFFLLIPARISLNLLKSTGTEDKDVLIKTGISVSLGIIFLTLIGLITKSMGLDWTLLWILPIFSTGYLIYIWKKKISILKLGHFNFFIFIIILIGVSAQSLALFRGGWQTQEGFIFPSIHDNMWSIAISNELFGLFPFQNPAILGEPLRNHHYFYPLLLSITRSLTQIHIFDLYYRLGPILVSLLFGFSLYAVSSVLTTNNITKGLAVFLGYFSGSFAYLLPIFLGRNFDWKGNSFFADQPFDQIFNPYSVLGFSFFLFGIYALYKAIEHNNHLHFGWVVVSSLFLGSLYGFKSFGGIIASLGLISTFLFWFLRYRKKRLLPVVIMALLIFTPIFFLITEPGSAKFQWAPGWLLSEMMASSDKLDLPRFVEIESFYQSIHNTLGLMKIKMTEFVIYTVGNLGTRILGLMILLKILLTGGKLSDSRKIILTYSLFCIIIAFFIPILFNLGSNAYNIVQFTPYALVLLSIFTGISVEWMFQSSLKKSKKLFLITILFLIFLSIPVNIRNILGKLPIQGDVISTMEMAALDFLKDKTNDSAMILIDPRQFSYDPIYIPALSQRRVYLASPGYARQTGRAYDHKFDNLKNYFDNDSEVEFLLNNNLTYVYILKPNSYKKLNIKNNSGNYKVAYENEKVLILTI